MPVPTGRLMVSLIVILVFGSSSLFAQRPLYYQKEGLDEGDVIYLSPALHFSSGQSSHLAIEGLSVRLQEQNEGRYFSRGEFLSPVVTVPAFTTGLISFFGKAPAGTSLLVEIRVVDGPDGDWFVVEPETEFALDGSARRLQYRVTMVSDDGLATPRFDEMSLLLEEQKQSDWRGGATVAPEASVSPPPIIERAQWGATPVSGYSGHTPKSIIVHHTAGPSSSYTGSATIRAIQHYHMHSNHWKDIGYHMLIGPDGKVFRGRPEWARGAHCPPNGTRLGVSVVGHYSNEYPSQRAIDKLVHTLAYWCARYQISTSRITGHCDHADKDCPGRNIYRRMGEIRKAVNAMINSGRLRRARALHKADKKGD